MAPEKSVESTTGSTASSVHDEKPPMLRNTKPAQKTKTLDPSAATRNGRSYPIPSFFEYRAKPKEHDSL